MHSIWAVTRNTLAQALRMKVALVVVILLAVLLPLMSFIVSGDGTLGGKLQTYISYGMSLMSLLLCVLTIAVSTYTLTSDLKGKQIQLVVTKSIRRYQIVCGKLFGVIIMDVILLGLFSAIIYGGVILMPRITDASEDEIERAHREFFTARGSVMAGVDEAEIDKLVQRRYNELEKFDELPPNMTNSRILSELRGQELAKMRRVESGRRKDWELENVRPAAGTESIFIRFKYKAVATVPDSKIDATWIIGDYITAEQLGTGTTPIYRVDRRDVEEIYHEIEIPADAVTDDGRLGLLFVNLPVNGVAVIPKDVEVLYEVGTFEMNYVRAVLIILARLIFLASLGVSLSTWLSFPVAMLISVFFFCIGLTNGFVVESIEYLKPASSMIYAFTIRPLMSLLPRFDREFNPSIYMVSGRVLSWFFVAKVYAMTIFVKSLVMTLFGVWIFSNREIAKTVV